MAFGCNLMADPVSASDGKTYERESIELWMKICVAPDQRAFRAQVLDSE